MADLTDEQIIQWVDEELYQRVYDRYHQDDFGRVTFCMVYPGSGQPPQLAVTVAGNPCGRLFDVSDPDLIDNIWEWMAGEPYRPLGTS